MVPGASYLLLLQLESKAGTGGGQRASLPFTELAGGVRAEEEEVVEEEEASGSEMRQEVGEGCEMLFTQARAPGTQGPAWSLTETWLLRGRLGSETGLHGLF